MWPQNYKISLGCNFHITLSLMKKIVSYCFFTIALQKFLNKKTSVVTYLVSWKWRNFESNRKNLTCEKSEFAIFTKKENCIILSLFLNQKVTILLVMERFGDSHKLTSFEMALSISETHSDFFQHGVTHKWIVLWVKKCLLLILNQEWWP